MVGAIITVLFIVAVLYLAHRRAPLQAFALSFTVLLLAYTALGSPAPVWKTILWLLLIGLWLLNVRPLRIALISRRFMRTYRRLLPAMSDTEREALEAGTVWWDGELFTGRPDWRKLEAAAPPALSEEEQAFLDGLRHAVQDAG
jgi:acyl-CoA dehydrogenase